MSGSSDRGRPRQPRGTPKGGEWRKEGRGAHGDGDLPDLLPPGHEGLLALAADGRRDPATGADWAPERIVCLTDGPLLKANGHEEGMLILWLDHEGHHGVTYSDLPLPGGVHGTLVANGGQWEEGEPDVWVDEPDLTGARPKPVVERTSMGVPPAGTGEDDGKPAPSGKERGRPWDPGKAERLREKRLDAMMRRVRRRRQARARAVEGRAAIPASKAGRRVVRPRDRRRRRLGRAMGTFLRGLGALARSFRMR